MSELQQYRCPCCGGAITFNSGTQKMKCPYCDTEFEVETLAKYDAELANSSHNMEWNMDSTNEWQEGEEEGMRVYICNSCGGEIIADENTAASFCPYCDSPVVMKGSLSGSLKPDYIIPFHFDKKAAVEHFEKHLKGKRLLPKVFKEQNHIEEIKGIYVPYWLFDTEADVNMRYRATRVRSWSDSNYNYTETSYYAVTRQGDIAFAHVPVDGSSKMPDDMMESLEPYYFSEAKPFQSAYFAGYYADKYDVGKEECVARANERVERAAFDSFMRTIHGYATVIPDGGNIFLSDAKVSYGMYPVWILHTKWNEKDYMFAMNGQTGKFVGNLPVDMGAMIRHFLLSFGASFLLVFAILMGMWFL